MTHSQPNADVLAEVLRSVSLRGTVYFRADFRAPWGMDIAAGQFANFHVVTAGECWIRVSPDADLVRLGAGDVALFPRGDGHALLSPPDATTPPARDVMAELSTSNDGSYGGTGQATTLICGHFEYDKDLPHPLFELLPSLVHLRTRGASQVIETATTLAAAEASNPSPGSSAIVDRLGEVLLVEVLRRWSESNSPSRGFVAGLGDLPVARGLAAIHREPSRDWTVADLAKVAGASRSAFADKFKAATALTPVQYLTQWRMLRARELLAEAPHLAISEVAAAVGYSSEFAFSKAFKRATGSNPSEVRARPVASAGRS